MVCMSGKFPGRIVSKPGHHKSVWLGVCLLFLLVACSTAPEISDKEINSKYANLTPSEALKITTEHFDKATSEQYEYFSPSNWQHASNALLEAQKLAGKNADDPQILKNIYLVDRRLESAKYIKSSVQKQYSDLFAARRILNDNHVHKSYPKENEKTEIELTRLIRDFEDLTLGNNKENVSQRSIEINAHTLMNNMQALNIRVVKFNYLQQGKQDLATLEGLDAKNIIPRTYNEAVDALAKANQYIEQNVHDKSGITQVSEAFDFAVDHASHVIKAVIELSQKDIKQLEDVVLTNEQNLYVIGRALGSNDVRNLPLAEQSQAIVVKANNMLDHHTEKSAMIVDLSEKNLLLQSELKKHQQKCIR